MAMTKQDGDGQGSEEAADLAEIERLARLPLAHSPLTPAPALRAQILRDVAKNTAPTRTQVERRDRGLLLAMVGLPVLTFIAFGAVRAEPRPSMLVLSTALGSLLLATLAAGLVFYRRRSMISPPKAWLLLVITLLPCALLLWKIGVTSGYEDMMVRWHARPGFRCLRLSCFLSAVPLLGALLLRRNSETHHPRLVGAGMGAAVGGFTWVLVDLWCPVGYVPHVLLGHVLPLLLATLAGFVAGKRLLGINGAKP
jgi:hypothetical protein